jgi:hypothetical protein
MPRWPGSTRRRTRCTKSRSCPTAWPSASPSSVPKRTNLSRPYLMARLAVMLGGRSGEEIAIGEITTGAENDLLQATQLARRMVTSWGMSELGLAAYDSRVRTAFWATSLARAALTARGVDHNSGHPSNRPRYLTRNTLIGHGFCRIILQLRLVLAGFMIKAQRGHPPGTSTWRNGTARCAGSQRHC